MDCFVLSITPPPRCMQSLLGSQGQGGEVFSCGAASCLETEELCTHVEQMQNETKFKLHMNLMQGEVEHVG
jgi:hypothetical protein